MRISRSYPSPLQQCPWFCVTLFCPWCSGPGRLALTSAFLVPWSLSQYVWISPSSFRDPDEEKVTERERWPGSRRIADMALSSSPQEWQSGAGFFYNLPSSEGDSHFLKLLTIFSESFIWTLAYFMAEFYSFSVTPCKHTLTQSHSRGTEAEDVGNERSVKSAVWLWGEMGTSYAFKKI